MKSKTYCDTVTLSESMEVLQMCMKDSAKDTYRARLKGDEDSEGFNAYICHCLSCAYRWLEEFTENLDIEIMTTRVSFEI